MNDNNDIWLEAKKALSEYESQFNALNNGSTLLEGQQLCSGNGYYLVMQEDGNLVLYNTQLWTPLTGIWHSSTHNKGNRPLRAIMQHDGNFVIYDSSNTSLWHTGTHGKGKAPYRLVLQKDGNLVIYDGNNKGIWSSNTCKS